VIGRAACRGAATIVNAIATGTGAAFGITLETDAKVEIEEGAGEIVLSDSEESPDLPVSCVRAVASKTIKRQVSGEVHVRSEIPVSRGLKSSSAVSNAVVLATARALGRDLNDMDVLLTGIEESIKAGVTITGAFDDASACFLGGVVITNNRSFTILNRGNLDPDLVVLIHVPERRITKASLKKVDFGSIAGKVEQAVNLAMKGDYLKAMELNSRAYSKVLDVSEEVAEIARKSGALAAGISGTGPATVALCQPGEAGPVLKALQKEEGTVLRAHVNDVPSREVTPRLF
jgi:shikimate kinase